MRRIYDRLGEISIKEYDFQTKTNYFIPLKIDDDNIVAEWEEWDNEKGRYTTVRWKMPISELPEKIHVIQFYAINTRFPSSENTTVITLTKEEFLTKIKEQMQHIKLPVRI